MNSVERVRQICKERKIAISKLEKDLGFGNGYIGQLKRGVFTAERLDAIAEYLSVTPEFLMYGMESKKEPPDEFVLTEGEKKLIQLLRKFPTDRQEFAVGMVLSALENMPGKEK